MFIVTVVFVAVVLAAALMIGHSLRLRAANHLLIGGPDEEKFVRQRTVQVMWLVAAIPVSIFGIVGLIALAFVANH